VLTAKGNVQGIKVKGECPMNKLQSPLAAVVQSSRRRFQRENHAKAIYHTAVIRRTEGLSVGLLLKPHELLVRFRFGLVSVCSL